MADIKLGRDKVLSQEEFDNIYKEYLESKEKVIFWRDKYRQIRNKAPNEDEINKEAFEYDGIENAVSAFKDGVFFVFDKLGIKYY